MEYKITHDLTGETHTGTAEEISKITGVLPVSIVKYASDGKKISRIWSIETIPNPTPKVNKIPKELWSEWEKVTRPFKEIYARKTKAAVDT